MSAPIPHSEAWFKGKFVGSRCPLATDGSFSPESTRQTGWSSLREEHRRCPGGNAHATRGFRQGTVDGPIAAMKKGDQVAGRLA